MNWVTKNFFPLVLYLLGVDINLWSNIVHTGILLTLRAFLNRNDTKNEQLQDFWRCNKKGFNFHLMPNVFGSFNRPQPLWKRLTLYPKKKLQVFWYFWRELKQKGPFRPNRVPFCFFSTVKFKLFSKQNPWHLAVLLFFLGLKRGADLCRSRLVVHKFWKNEVNSTIAPILCLWFSIQNNVNNAWFLGTFARDFMLALNLTLHVFPCKSSENFTLPQHLYQPRR